MKGFAAVTAVVLAVVGIGIGLVDGATYPVPSTRYYSAGSLSFYAAFPLLDSPRFHSGWLRASSSKPRSVGMRSYEAWSDGPYAYDVSVTVLRLGTWTGSRLAAKLYPNYLTETGLAIRRSTSNGTRTITAGPSCGGTSPGFQRGSCLGVKVVQRGSIRWIVQARSSGEVPDVTIAFLKSFGLPSWGNLAATS